MPNNTKARIAGRPVQKSLAADLSDTGLMNELTMSRGEDDKPWRELKIRHEGLVLNVLGGRGVRGCDAEDVAAEVWVRVWRLAQLGQWDPARAVHTQDSFVPLLKKMSENIAIDFQRKAVREKRKRARLERHVQLFGADWQTKAARPRGPRAAERPAASGVPSCLVTVVASLPVDLRVAYELHAQGLGCRAIGERLRCSAATASRRVKRARERIRTISPLPPGDA